MKCRTVTETGHFLYLHCSPKTNITKLFREASDTDEKLTETDRSKYPFLRGITN